MEIACVLCNTRMETTKEDVYVTVRWMLKEILQLNQETANEVPRARVGSVQRAGQDLHRNPRWMIITGSTIKRSSSWLQPRGEDQLHWSRDV